jgi:prepilin-type N-terminal cleavage/methylation domain-containing protein
MRRSKPPGFTLIEVLIAIALLLALMGTMYGFLFDMLTSRSRALEFARQDQAAAVLIKTLDADLMSCIAGDRVSGAGVSGDETRVRVLSRGVASSLAQRGDDDADVFGDLQFTEFQFDRAAQSVQMERGPVGRVASASDAERFGGVYKLRFRYHDGRAWRRSFDSAAEKRLPAAIEIAVWLRPLPGQDEEGEALENVGPASQPEESSPTAPVEQTPNPDASEPAAETSSDDPPPDRIRVILIPDSEGEAADG